jgi:sec-independent protein translocase protein TatC
MRNLLRSFWHNITAPFRLFTILIRGISRRLRNRYQRIVAFFTEEEEDTSLPDAFAKTIENPQGILFHLNELRKHLLRSIIVLIITTTLAFTYITKIMEFLAIPLEGGLDALKAIEVTENIGTVMRVSLLSGFAIAFPYIVFELWLFIAPGIRTRSRLKGLFAIPVAIMLFVAGLAFTYYIMLPTALPFLFNFMGLTTEARPASYFSFVTGLLFWIGIAFEFPLLTYFLADFGIVDADMLKSQWRLAIVIIAVLAAAVTPTIDPINMGLVMAPMIALYFLSILLAMYAQRARKKNAHSIKGGA